MTKNKKELSYWMALAHLEKIRLKRKHDLILQIISQDHSIIDFFHQDLTTWKDKYKLNSKEIDLLNEAKSELANNSFLIEDLLEQGYNIIPILSKDYPDILKKKLKFSRAPLLLYIKGDKQLLKDSAVAIVGSRSASQKSLRFTNTIAKKVCDQNKVVVSGYAKGVDRQALVSAINFKGKSIIVLPQGITTFKSGFKKYYKHIINGDVLVSSIFHPNVPWSPQNAMARNPIIYGLAGEIYVAESNEKGGTWSGVIDGLRKGHKIYIRKPSQREKNANLLLIEKGAIPVDDNGKILKNEIQTREKNKKIYDEKILELLKKKPLTSKDIIKNLNLSLTQRNVTDYLKNHPKIITLNKHKPLKFKLKNDKFKQKKII